MTTQPNETIRISIYCKRRADLTPDQFYHHWETVHAKLTAPWLAKYGVMAYSQIHCPKPPTSSSSDDAISPPFEYDGMAEFDVQNMDLFRRAFADPYYREVVKADEVNFLDTSVKLVRSMGSLKRIVDGGKVVVDLGSDVARVWEEYEARSGKGEDDSVKELGKVA